MGTVKQALFPHSAQFRTTAFPQLVRTQGTNFPVLSLAYDAATEEAAFFAFEAVDYGSGNITITVKWQADTASSGDVRWMAQIAAITPNTDTQDVETKAFATANTATDTHLGTTGQRAHAIDITVSNLDSLASGDTVWLRLARDADDAGDTMAGDALLLGLILSYSDT